MTTSDPGGGNEILPDRNLPIVEQKPSGLSVQPHDWQKLTPIDIFRFARLWSVKSWLFVSASIFALCSAAYALGYSYAAGLLPDFAYVWADPQDSPQVERKRRESEAAFKANYDLIVDWQKLRAIAAGILKDSPDGLSSEYEVAASLLAQVRGSRGKAHFLSGTKQYSVTLRPEGDTVKLDWDNGDSLIPRIARDAGVDLTPEQLKIANSNLNWAQFTYLDDAMERVLVYRGIDGNLNLTIRQ